MNNYPDARTYYDKMHRLGKWMTFITLIVFCGVPFVVCMVYGIMPKISDVLLASGGLLAIFIPAAIAELIADTPVMGTSFYLSSITGNIMNLKLPAVLNALKIADVKQGNPGSRCGFRRGRSRVLPYHYDHHRHRRTASDAAEANFGTAAGSDGNAIRPASFIWMSDALHLQQKRRWRHCFPRPPESADYPFHHRCCAVFVHHSRIL